MSGRLGSGLPHPSGGSGRWVDEGSSDGNELGDDRSWPLYKNYERYLYGAFRGDKENSGVKVGKMKEVARGIYVEIIGWSKDNDAFRGILRDYPNANGISVDSEPDDTGYTVVRAFIPWPERREPHYPSERRERSGGWKIIDQPRLIISALVGVTLLAAITTEGEQWLPIARLVGVL